MAQALRLHDVNLGDMLRRPPLYLQKWQSDIGFIYSSTEIAIQK